MTDPPCYIYLRHCVDLLRLKPVTILYFSRTEHRSWTKSAELLWKWSSSRVCYHATPRLFVLTALPALPRGLACGVLFQPVRHNAK
ncbi:hypothetical protein N431DRAFT_125857 [Stipitochalara longipes BDJ]|nr:hypothetical protein N431DRAFT_125857 [Stipitochalara longipes BDJ]